MVTVILQPKTSADLRPSFTALARQLKALGDPTRLAIIALLVRREHCVCDLMTALALPQSTCSHHLGVLKRADLVRDRRGGDAARAVRGDPRSDGVRPDPGRLRVAIGARVGFFGPNASTGVDLF